MTDHTLSTCSKCGGKFLADGNEWCPDCIAEFTPACEEPDVVDLIEGKFYAKRRERDAARSLDNFEDDD